MQVGDTVACLILPRSAVSFIPEEGHVMLIAGGLKIKLTENTLVDGSQGGTPQEMLTNLYSLL